DWLACEFMEPEVTRLQGDKVTSGFENRPSHVTNHLVNSSSPQPWSIKSLIRLVVTSATYRQSSGTRPELAERDPFNTLLALQALTLMNHGLFVECARTLARRVSALPARPPRGKIEAAFQLCLSRPPARAELDRLERLFADELALAPDPTCSAAQENALTQVA